MYHKFHNDSLNSSQYIILKSASVDYGSLREGSVLGYDSSALMSLTNYDNAEGRNRGDSSPKSPAPRRYERGRNSIISIPKTILTNVLDSAHEKQYLKSKKNFLIPQRLSRKKHV